MPSTSTIDPRWPVLVGVGQVEQRTEDFHDALSPDALLVEAALKAQADSGTDGLLGSVDTVAVIRILSWRYRDPGALVARRLGISPRHTIVTDDGGNYPQTLAQPGLQLADPRRHVGRGGSSAAPRPGAPAPRHAPRPPT
jgi:hypothetical protein